MKKFILMTFVLSFVSSTYAGTSCYSLYAKKSEEIREKKAHNVHLGGEFIVINGNVTIVPGVSVPAKINNWAEDLLSAIKYGPEMYGWSEENPKRDWLENLNSAIKRHCRLDDDPYHTTLREMMNELMEDGSFCPDSKVLNSSLFTPYKHFKRIMKESVQSGRFSDRCGGKVVDNSDRSPKNVERGLAGSKSMKEKNSSKQ